MVSAIGGAHRGTASSAGPSFRISVCSCLRREASSMRASAGTFSISHCPNQLSEPVRIKTPVKTSSTPITISTRPRWRRKRCRKRDEGADGDRGQDERHAEPQRVDEQQAHAGAEAALVGRQRQYGRQHRPDARRPAEGEGETHDEGARQAGARRMRRGCAPPDRAGHAQQPRKCRPKPMMIEAGDDRQLALVRLDPLAEHRRAGAEADEHRGEAQHEKHARPARRAATRARRCRPCRSSARWSCRRDSRGTAAPAAARRATESSPGRPAPRRDGCRPGSASVPPLSARCCCSGRTMVLSGARRGRRVNRPPART